MSRRVYAIGPGGRSPGVDVASGAMWKRIPPGPRFMVVSALAFSVMSVLVKWAGQRLPSQEIVGARAAVSLGVAAVFAETHQDPDNAPCDGPNMIYLDQMPGLIADLMAFDALAKSRPLTI